MSNKRWKFLKQICLTDATFDILNMNGKLNIKNYNKVDIQDGD